MHIYRTQLTSIWWLHNPLTIYIYNSPFKLNKPTMQVWTHLTLRNSIEKPLLARLAIYMYTCHHWPFIFKELWGELSLDPGTESVLT